MTQRPLALSTTLLVAALAVTGLRGDEAPSQDQPPQTPKQALVPFNGLVGEWRGVGQVRRGSREGAWLETAEWVWDFEDGTAVVGTVDKGKHLKTARITWNPRSKTYHVAATLPEDRKRTYVGRLDEQKLVAESKPDDDGWVHRLTITMLNPKRTLVRFEKRKAKQSFYSRLGEVGYTRKGTKLASGNQGPECIVTGGLGTIPVSFEGKTYYVCCTGCKQAFDDDPAGVVQEYLEKVAARKKQAPEERE